MSFEWVNVKREIVYVQIHRIAKIKSNKSTNEEEITQMHGMKRFHKRKREKEKKEKEKKGGTMRRALHWANN